MYIIHVSNLTYSQNSHASRDFGCIQRLSCNFKYQMTVIVDLFKLLLYSLVTKSSHAPDLAGAIWLPPNSGRPRSQEWFYIFKGLKRKRFFHDPWKQPEVQLSVCRPGVAGAECTPPFLLGLGPPVRCQQSWQDARETMWSQTLKRVQCGPWQEKDGGKNRRIGHKIPYAVIPEVLLLVTCFLSHILSSHEDSNICSVITKIILKQSVWGFKKQLGSNRALWARWG